MRPFIYRNLNRKGWTYSLRNKGLVVGYATSILIAAPDFRVSEAGRQRILAHKRKNVHAGIVGEVLDVRGYVTRLVDEKTLLAGYTASNIAKSWDAVHDFGIPISYNPYRAGHFIEKSTGNPVHYATFVSIRDRDVRALLPNVFVSEEFRAATNDYQWA